MANILYIFWLLTVMTIFYLKLIKDSTKYNQEVLSNLLYAPTKCDNLESNVKVNSFN